MSEESGATDTWAEEAPTLAGLGAASVQGLIALGPRAGARVARYGTRRNDDSDGVTGAGFGQPYVPGRYVSFQVTSGSVERLRQLTKTQALAPMEGISGTPPLILVCSAEESITSIPDRNAASSKPG
jgi:hypothetical protein